MVIADMISSAVEVQEQTREILRLQTPPIMTHKPEETIPQLVDAMAKISEDEGEIRLYRRGTMDSVQIDELTHFN